ncbi:AbrB/MazE/SpoVT family DNA-binding domain-containing protein [Candidatus Nanohalovita haloferacivicina]|uniref:AbrB/MazE/SpoVT family DNA-binding domain-containing protein n=1 Tax=Candidatus Nanohalovita haloferacivicina TaxID=2978046 RepID=UPI00325FA57E|nr:AbrB family transcriptional regulator [Candidatus Nanohalobia archaeon BNXNv]
MAVFTPCFSAKIDSKGRITIPSEIRDRLNLDEGQKVFLSVQDSTVVRKSFDSRDKALDFLSGLENVEGFSFDGEVLEVIFSE